MPAKASRAAFGEALLELGARDERIVTLDAALSKATMTVNFAKKFPGRAFNLGIAESNMIGVASGLALTGKIPFACSFACFVVGRFETIRMSVAYTNANVKIVGTHSGIAIGEDGYSQMGLEDIACIRSLPNVPIIQPAEVLPMPLKRLGVTGFGESGDPKGLYAKHGLDPAGLEASIRKFLHR